MIDFLLPDHRRRHPVRGQSKDRGPRTFLAVLFSGLIMNWFEPLAGAWTESPVPPAATRIALLGLFAESARFASRRSTHADVRRGASAWCITSPAGTGAGHAVITMAILLTALHARRLPREFMGFRPERKTCSISPPDRQWLALTQYVSETSPQKSYGPWFDAPASNGFRRQGD
jgi:hypothetical protein